MYRKINLHISKFCAVLLLIVSLSSCITSKDINYLQNPVGSIPLYENNVGYEEYVLAPFDKIFIRLYSLDEKTNALINGNIISNNLGMNDGATNDLYTYTIREDGNITLPTIGEIRLDGLYLREAKKVIERSIQAYMIDKCAVDVQIVGRYFSVIGSDINGKFPIYKEKMNIFQAMAMAGDIGTYGDRKSIKILRETPDGKEIKVFDIRSREIINSEFYYIQPNDVIYIQEINSKFFSITNIGQFFSTILSTISVGLFTYNLIAPDKKDTTPTTTVSK